MPDNKERVFQHTIFRFVDLQKFTHIKVANHAGRLRSIRRESKRRPKLPIYPLPEPNDFDSWQKIIFGRTLPRPLESEQGKVLDNSTLVIKLSLDEEEPSPKIEASDTSEDRVINLDEIETGIPPLLRVILRLTTHQISGLFDTLALIIEKNNCLLPRCGEWIFSLLAAQGKVHLITLAAFLIQLNLWNLQLLPEFATFAVHVENVAMTWSERPISVNLS